MLVLFVYGDYTTAELLKRRKEESVKAQCLQILSNRSIQSRERANQMKRGRMSWLASKGISSHRCTLLREKQTLKLLQLPMHARLFGIKYVIRQPFTFLFFSSSLAFFCSTFLAAFLSAFASFLFSCASSSAFARALSFSAALHQNKSTKTVWMQIVTGEERGTLSTKIQESSFSKYLLSSLVDMNSKYFS